MKNQILSTVKWVSSLKMGSRASVLNIAAGLLAAIALLTPAKSHALASPVSIGTLPPGKSVRVIHTVTINSSIPPGVSTITAQGTVSGGNFSSVQTDDPDLGGAADATVTTVDVPPVLSNVTKNGVEGIVMTFAASDFTAAYSDGNSDPLSTVTITSLPANGTLKLSLVDIVVNQIIPAGSLGNITFVPDADYFGSSSFGWTAADATLTADSGALVNITIANVNDVPVFTAGGNQVVRINLGAQAVSAWATGISAGPNESSQTVDFIVGNNNNGLFSAQPAIDASGNLTFTSASSAAGKATVTVQIHDDGGTSNGGVDTSSAITFLIEVMTVPWTTGDYIVTDRGPYVSTGTILVVRADGSQEILTTALKDPYGITFDLNGNIIVADYEFLSSSGTGGIYRLNKYTLARTRIPSLGNFKTPFGVAVETDGMILVADLDAFGEIGAVFRVHPTTGAQTTLSTGDNFFWLRGIAVNTNSGDIYVSDLTSSTPGNEAVIRINPSSGVQTILSQGGPSGGLFIRPDGLAIEYPSGHIIVADAGAKKIIRVNKTSGMQTLISDDSQFILPTHVAVDANGDFLVTDGPVPALDGQRRLYKVDKTTGVATIISFDGFFDQPRGVVVGY